MEAGVGFCASASVDRAITKAVLRRITWRMPDCNGRLSARCALNRVSAFAIAFLLEARSSKLASHQLPNLVLERGARDLGRIGFAAHQRLGKVQRLLRFDLAGH